jgi:hypothetical protein
MSCRSEEIPTPVTNPETFNMQNKQEDWENANRVGDYFKKPTCEIYYGQSYFARSYPYNVAINYARYVIINLMIVRIAERLSSKQSRWIYRKSIFLRKKKFPSQF